MRPLAITKREGSPQGEELFSCALSSHKMGSEAVEGIVSGAWFELKVKSELDVEVFGQVEQLFVPTGIRNSMIKTDNPLNAIVTLGRASPSRLNYGNFDRVIPNRRRSFVVPA